MNIKKVLAGAAAGALAVTSLATGAFAADSYTLVPTIEYFSPATTTYSQAITTTINKYVVPGVRQEILEHAKKLDTDGTPADGYAYEFWNYTDKAYVFADYAAATANQPTDEAKYDLYSEDNSTWNVVVISGYDSTVNGTWAWSEVVDSLTLPGVIDTILKDEGPNGSSVYFYNQKTTPGALESELSENIDGIVNLVFYPYGSGGLGWDSEYFTFDRDEDMGYLTLNLTYTTTSGATKTLTDLTDHYIWGRGEDWGLAAYVDVTLTSSDSSDTVKAEANISDLDPTKDIIVTGTLTSTYHPAAEKYAIDGTKITNPKYTDFNAIIANSDAAVGWEWYKGPQGSIKSTVTLEKPNRLTVKVGEVTSETTSSSSGYYGSYNFALLDADASVLSNGFDFTVGVAEAGHYGTADDGTTGVKLGEHKSEVTAVLTLLAADGANIYQTTSRVKPGQTEVTFSVDQADITNIIGVGNLAYMRAVVSFTGDTYYYQYAQSDGHSVNNGRGGVFEVHAASDCFESTGVATVVPQNYSDSVVNDNPTDEEGTTAPDDDDTNTDEPDVSTGNTDNDDNNTGNNGDTNTGDTNNGTGDTNNGTSTGDKNQPTGVALAVIPAALAAAGVIVSKKRK